MKTGADDVNARQATAPVADIADADGDDAQASDDD